MKIIKGVNSGKIGIVKGDDEENYRLATYQGLITVKKNNCEIYTNKVEDEEIDNY